MELLVIQELTLAVADIWATNALVPLVRACVNAVVLSPGLLENKNKKRNCAIPPSSQD